MPKEDRRILFTSEEVYKAIYALSVQKQTPRPPAGAITSIVMTTDDPPKLILQLQNPAQNTNERVEYTYEFVTAALMLFCRGLGIPLPRKATKSVLMMDGAVILRVQV